MRLVVTSGRSIVVEVVQLYILMISMTITTAATTARMSSSSSRITGSVRASSNYCGSGRRHKLINRLLSSSSSSSSIAFIHQNRFDTTQPLLVSTRNTRHHRDWRWWQQQQQQQQQQQRQSQHTNSIFSKPSNIVMMAYATTTVAIFYQNSSLSNTRRITTTTMTLCDTLDPDRSSGDDNGAKITLSPSSKASATPTVNKEPVEKHSTPERPLLLFPPNCFDYDHYSGVTIDLQQCIEDNISVMMFEERLKQQLQIWKAEGRIRGVWIHVPPQLASHIPICVDNGFSFHMVSPTAQISHSDDLSSNAANEEKKIGSNNNVLILSQWLPDSPSRLPVGPTHQVGVGCLVWHPTDSPLLGPQRRLLVVQEKSGPAAAFQLWKLPTGLADPNEDIHTAAIREFLEETGLVGIFNGLMLVRQAHPNVITTARTDMSSKAATIETSKRTTHSNEKDGITKEKPKTSSVQRKTSDLFFICQMTLQQSEPSNDDVDNDGHTPIWTACPDEIAAIQWMPVEDYCNQIRWQSSPLYMELNRVILDSASAHSMTTTALSSINTNTEPPALWNDTTLPVWVDNNNATIAKEMSTYTNTFYAGNKK